MSGTHFLWTNIKEDEKCRTKGMIPYLHLKDVKCTSVSLSDKIAPYTATQELKIFN